MSTTVVVTTAPTTPPPSGRWNVCVLATDIVMCVLVAAGCLVGLLADWVSVEVVEHEIFGPNRNREKKDFSLADLRDMGTGNQFSNTESSAQAATAFLALLLVCAVVVGVLAVVWIVSPSSGLRLYPFTTIPISLLGILSIAMTAWSWSALLDDTKDVAHKSKFLVTITVKAEAGGIIGLIAAILACVLGIVKCGALCCCRPAECTPNTQNVGVNHTQGAPVAGIPIQHGGMQMQPQQYQVQPQQYQVQPQQYPVQPVQYPVQPQQYPVQPLMQSQQYQAHPRQCEAQTYPDTQPEPNCKA